MSDNEPASLLPGKVYSLVDTSLRTYDTPLNRPEKAGDFLTEGFVRHPCLEPRPPIYNVPLRILYLIFELFAPQRTREGVYRLTTLTHVCKYWRVMLTSKHEAWTTVFATQSDRRSFVDMCLERSYPLSLEVTVDARSYSDGPARSSCTCIKGDFFELIHNWSEPCEWHFAFESLVETKHSGRICTLNIVLDDGTTVFNKPELVLESCQFFKLPYLQPTSLKWDDSSAPYPDLLSYPSFFSPTLRSLSFRGWSGSNQVLNLNNLISFTFDNHGQEISAESFRMFILNSQFLETLALFYINLEGDSNGPLAALPNLKSFSIHYSEYSRGMLSTIFRVPALQRLSSIVISATEEDNSLFFTLRATGDEIVLTIKCDLQGIEDAWKDLTGYAKPKIQYVRFGNPIGQDFYHAGSERVETLSMNAQRSIVVRGFEFRLPGYWLD